MKNKDISMSFLIANLFTFILLLLTVFIWLNLELTQTVRIDEKQLEKLTTEAHGVTAKRLKSGKRTIIMHNLDSTTINSAETSFNVSFNNESGGEFAKLNISPQGEKTISLPVYSSGQFIEFNSNSGEHVATVLSVDFETKNIVVDVSNVIDDTNLSEMINSSDCLKLGVISEVNGCIKYESILRELKEGPLAYNRPDKMIRGDTMEISLVIDPTDIKDPSIGLTNLEGEIVESKSKISRHMSAELYGVNFNIEPNGLQKKLTTSFSPTRWRWKVKPLFSGKDKILTLNIFAHIEQKDKVSDPVILRTFRDEIQVDVKAWDQVLDVVKEIQPVHTLIIALIGSFSGLFLWWRQR